MVRHWDILGSRLPGSSPMSCMYFFYFFKKKFFLPIVNSIVRGIKFHMCHKLLIINFQYFVLSILLRKETPRRKHQEGNTKKETHRRKHQEGKSSKETKSMYQGLISLLNPETLGPPQSHHPLKWAPKNFPTRKRPQDP